MSELRYYKLFYRTRALTSPEFISVVEFGDDDEVYLKSEADKVIKEKDKEIAELKAKLETVQASAYADSVDVGMRERRLRRALYKACANWADVEVFERTVGIGDPNVEANRWALMRNKCLKKAEEYK